MTARTCRRCHATQPIDDFPIYSAKGYTGHRHVCQACVRLYRVRWEMNLDPIKAETYMSKKAASDAAYKARERSSRPRAYRERSRMMRGIVVALKSQGYTQKDIAQMAGLCPKTIQRIEHESRPVFHEPTERKILNLYARLKGVAV